MCIVRVFSCFPIALHRIINNLASQVYHIGQLYTGCPL